MSDLPTARPLNKPDTGSGIGQAPLPLPPPMSPPGGGPVAGVAGSAERSPVPTPLRVTSEVCWRLLVIAAAAGLLIFLIVELRVVVIPVSIAVLISALLSPIVVWLNNHRVPRGIATVLVLIGGIAVLGGLLTFVVNTFIQGLPALQDQLTASFTSIEPLLTGPPLNLPSDFLQRIPAQLSAALNENREALTSGALSTAATVGELAAGAALVLFSVIFFLDDGPTIWRFTLRLAPRARRERVDTAGRRAFASLVDAVGIGIGLGIVGVPLVIPLAALVFLGAFIPTVGAVLTGGIAVLIALVANGPVAAVIILAVVVAVQQLEGHVLQPLLLGRAVSLHPLAVVLGVAAGVVIAGLVGALLAVPVLAVISTAVRSLAAPVEQSPADVNAVSPRHAHPMAPDAPPAGPGAVARMWRRMTGPGPAEES